VGQGLVQKTCRFQTVLQRGGVTREDGPDHREGPRGGPAGARSCTRRGARPA
jgi:hypothetical protein